MKKRGLKAFFLSILIALSVSITSFAGWEQDNSGWKYQNSNGSYQQNGWHNDNGTWYYFGQNGYMQTGWIQDNSNWYFLNSNGSMKTGWLQDGSNWYYLHSNGVMACNTTIDGYQLGSDGAWKDNSSLQTVAIQEETKIVQETQAIGTSVWIATTSGTKYHRSTCRTIKSSTVAELSLATAKNRGYEACKVCNPPLN